MSFSEKLSSFRILRAAESSGTCQRCGAPLKSKQISVGSYENGGFKHRYYAMVTWCGSELCSEEEPYPFGRRTE